MSSESRKSESSYEYSWDAIRFKYSWLGFKIYGRVWIVMLDVVDLQLQTTEVFFMKDFIVLLAAYSNKYNIPILYVPEIRLRGD